MSGAVIAIQRIPSHTPGERHIPALLGITDIEDPRRTHP